MRSGTTALAGAGPAEVGQSVALGPVLVTGAAGFAGSRLVAELVKTGVRAVGTGKPGDPKPDAAGGTDLRWIEADLTEPASIDQLLADVQPAQIVHLAAVAVPRQAARDPLHALRVNYLAVHHLLEAMKRRVPEARLLLVSSGEVYGRRPREAPAAGESTPLSPQNIYAATKAAAEARLWISVEEDGLDGLCARPFNHTGPGRPIAYAEASFAQQIVEIEAGRREPVVRVGNLDAIRDFSDVRDVVHAYLLLLAHGQQGHAYNVCSGRGRSIREVLDLLVAQAEVPIEVEVDPARFEPTTQAQVALVGDPGGLRALGWTPRYPLEETLRDLLDAFRARV